MAGSFFINIPISLNAAYQSFRGSDIFRNLVIIHHI